MFSLINYHRVIFKSIFERSIKCVRHRRQGNVFKGGQRSLEIREKGELRQQMIEDAENIEEFHDWVEDKMHNPEFKQTLLSEEEKMKRRIKFKIIERKYFKKPPEINLLTWDAKAQIRFLNNEYPDEWTIDRLAESFPVSREGIVKLLKSRFSPKSVEDIVKHDQRVQKNWKQLKEGKKNGLLEGGPIISSYQVMLKNAAGNPSLPTPDLNRLLLNPGRSQRRNEKPGVFLSIVKDYCNEKESGRRSDLASTNPTTNARLYEHISRNRTMADGFLDKTHSKNLNLVSSSSASSHTLKVSPSNSSFGRKKNSALHSEQLIDADFNFKATKSDDLEDDFIQPSQEHNQEHTRPRSRHTRFENTGLSKDEVFPGMKGTQKLPASDKTLDKMEENSRLALEDKRTNPRRSLNAKTKEILREIQAGTIEDGEVYVFSKEKGYQHPFGRKKDLPERKISVPQKSGSGTVFEKDGDYFDEDGEFLYRAP